MNVFFEGPNGSGKSTIADLVKNALHWDQVNLHHRDGDQFRRYLSEYGRTDTVFVRAHWSEEVYSTLFGRKTPFTQAEYDCLSQVAGLRGIVVLCLPKSAQVLKDRMQERKGIGLDTDKQSSLELCEREWDLWSRTLSAPLNLYNVADYVYQSDGKENLRQAVEEIIRMTQRGCS